MSDAATPNDAPPQASAEQLLLQVSTGYIVSSALQVAVRLGVADLLSNGPLASTELAEATGADEDALYRVLRALASVGVFEETASRRFALTPAAELLLTGTPGSLRDMALWMCDPFHFCVYAETMHSVWTGEPAVKKTVGMPVFEYFARESELSEVFNDAMTTFSAAVIPAVLKAYDFSGINVLVDVAGGHGQVLTSILREYPRMHGVLFDLEHVIAGAVPRIEAMGMRDRCETAAGDFFQAVPHESDAYLMKHIIHDWDDKQALVILKNIYAALKGKPQGKVILLESVIQSGNQPDLAKFIDIEMLLMPGGRERTAEEFAALFTGAGFKMSRIVATESPVSVIEARPR
jgi:hypothetical protein